MSWLRVIWRFFLLQLAITRRSPGHALTLVASLLLSIMFISLAVRWHRPSAVVNAILAPGLIGLWLALLDLAGQVIDEDRWSGRFELLVATRAPLSLIVLGSVLVDALCTGGQCGSAMAAAQHRLPVRYGVLRRQRADHLLAGWCQGRDQPDAATHGLVAIRLVLANAPPGRILSSVGMELAVAAGWFRKLRSGQGRTSGVKESRDIGQGHKQKVHRLARDQAEESGPMFKEGTS